MRPSLKVWKFKLFSCMTYISAWNHPLASLPGLKSSFQKKVMIPATTPVAQSTFPIGFISLQAVRNRVKSWSWALQPKQYCVLLPLMPGANLREARKGFCRTQSPPEGSLPWEPQPPWWRIKKIFHRQFPQPSALRASLHTPRAYRRKNKPSCLILENP